MTFSSPRGPGLVVLAWCLVLGACSAKNAGDGSDAATSSDADDAAAEVGDAASPSPDGSGGDVASGEASTDAGGGDTLPGDGADSRDGGLVKMLVIPATANLWGAGHAVPPDPSGQGPGVLPPVVELPPGTRRTMTITDVSGSVDFDGPGTGLPENGADGFLIQGLPPLTADAAAVHTDVDGIAGFICAPAACAIPRVAFLSAVFLDATEPAAPAPGPYAVDPRASTIDGVAIRQAFFVGDGFDGPYAGTGAVQTFLIPDGATRVFFGFGDAYGPAGLPGSYDDNKGEIRATVTISR